MAKKKIAKTDGLGPYEIKRIRSAVRDVWQYSLARNLVIKRCTGKDGFVYCEKCDDRTPKLKVDHIEKVGDVDDGFINRMFVPSSQLQGLCKLCHDLKTQIERQMRDEVSKIAFAANGIKMPRRKRKQFTDDL